MDGMNAPFFAWRTLGVPGFVLGCGLSATVIVAEPLGLRIPFMSAT
jgi:hypothetical protein